jgi:hypothetical protein
MTKEQIAALCERVGFPAPRFDHRKRLATIRVPLTLRGRIPKERMVRLGPLPKLTAADLDRWCADLGHAATARFINHHLGTGYTAGDVQKMRRQGKGISARIKALVRDFDQPFDPKT